MRSPARNTRGASVSQSLLPYALARPHPVGRTKAGIAVCSLAERFSAALQRRASLSRTPPPSPWPARPRWWWMPGSLGQRARDAPRLSSWRPEGRRMSKPARTSRDPPGLSGSRVRAPLAASPVRRAWQVSGLARCSRRVAGAASPAAGLRPLASRSRAIVVLCPPPEASALCASYSVASRQGPSLVVPGSPLAIARGGCLSRVCLGLPS